MIKNLVYGRHLLNQPMRIEAPIPYISNTSFHQNCPGYSDLCVILFREKMQAFYFKFDTIDQFYEYAIWHEVSTTPVSWCFAITRIIFFFGKKNAHPFLIMSSQANIWNTSYDQKSQRHLEVGVLRLN